MAGGLAGLCHKNKMSDKILALSFLFGNLQDQHRIWRIDEECAVERSFRP